MAHRAIDVPIPRLPFRSAVTLGRCVVDPGVPVECHDGRAFWRRVLVAAGPGVDPFTGSCREGGEERCFAEDAYLYLYTVSRLPGQQPNTAKPTCATRTVLLCQKWNWKSFRPTNRAPLR